MSTLVEYQLRIRDAANTTDVLVVTSVRGGTHPYIKDPPSCDGSEFDPLTGAYRSGSATFRIMDPILSGTTRLVTSQLEDAQFRQQLAGRPAYGEERVNGGAWASVQAGIVTGIRLASASTWEIDVGDTTRASRGLTAFAPLRDAVTTTQVEPLATYLARWPHRGCMAGGPIIGGFLGVIDRGGWEMTVVSVFNYPPHVVQLNFVAGYSAPNFTRTTNPKDHQDALNTAMGNHTSTVQTSTFPADLGLSEWRDVVVEIVGVGYFAAASIVDSNFADSTPGFMQVGAAHNRVTGFFVWDPGNVLSASGTVRRVRVYDALPSERSPIYFSGHPLDLWTKLCDEAGLTYDSSAVTSCKQALGNSRRISLRITGTADWSSFVESTLYGPCGFSVSTDASGRLVPFPTRITNSAGPSVSITSADVPQGETVLFDLTEADAITRVVFDQQNLIPTVVNQVGAATDGINVQSVHIERTSGDSSAPVQKEQAYSIPGFIDSGGLGPSGSAAVYEPGFVDAMAGEIFDRFSRGRIAGEVQFLRGGAGDPVTLGSEFAVTLPSMPNHNKRLLDDNSVPGRVVQALRITPTPRGKVVKFVDSGANANAVATLPTFTLALGPSAGSVQVTITNAATLNATSPPIAARFQWAITTGAAPGTGDYTDVAQFGAGAVATAAFTLPFVQPGQKVYVRARGEQAGLRPSAYGSASSVTTAAYGAPTGLTATPSGSDGTLCALAWTLGSGANALYTDIFLRLTADPASADVLQITLLPGSIAYGLEHLALSTNYTASVQHRDPTSGNVSAKTTVAFTSGSSTPALVTPGNPSAFAGSLTDGISKLDGTYGLAVQAVEVPGDVEFREAVETAIGSGSYGSFSTILTEAAVQGDWTIALLRAPNDGLRRKLSARSIRGPLASSYTADQVIAPWGAVVALPTFASQQALIIAAVQTGATQATRTYSVTITNPSGASASVTCTPSAYNVGVSPSTPGVNTIAAGASHSITYTVTIGAGFNNAQGQVKFAASATGLNTAVATVDVAAIVADTSQPISLEVDPSGNVIVRLNGSDNTANWEYAYNYGASPSTPSDASAYPSGTFVAGRAPSITLSLGLAMGDTIILKAVPLDAGGGPGQFVTATATRQNKLTSGKRVIFPGTVAQPSSNADVWAKGVQYLQSVNAGVTLTAWVPLTLPDGVTITQIESTTQRNGGGDTAVVRFFYAARGATSGTQIGSTQTNSTTGGPQLITQGSLSTLVDNANYTYYATVDLTPASLSVVYLLDVAIVYTSPDFTKTI